MDWSRAKNILIVMLLVTDLVIGGFYVASVRENRAERNEKIQAAEYYLETKGVELNCEIPKTPEKMPALTVVFCQASAEGEEYTTEFRGRKLEIIGLSQEGVSEIKSGLTRVKVRSCAYALINSVDIFADTNGRDISGIELIYYVNRLEYDEEKGEDTALPYWKITSSGGDVYYCPAFNE